MKKFISILLILSMLLGLCACGGTKVSIAGQTASLGNPPELTTIHIPADSTVLDKNLAEDLVNITGGVYAMSGSADYEQFYSNYNMELVAYNNFDKSNDDASHTAAYTIARGFTTAANGEDLIPVYLINIRGTYTGGEWLSNFNFISNNNFNTQFADNFYACASDIFDNGLMPLLFENEDYDPIVLITGHSRGASTANLLGYLCDGILDPAKVYAYTFATPTTVKTSYSGLGNSTYNNIFNFINPDDFVPCVPTAEWGYTRFGQDVILRQDGDQQIELIKKLLKASAFITPQMYYESLYGILCQMFSGGGENVEVDPEREAELSSVLETLTGITGLNLDMMALFAHHMPDEYRAKMADYFN